MAFPSFMRSVSTVASVAASAAKRMGSEEVPGGDSAGLAGPPLARSRNTSRPLSSSPTCPWRAVELPAAPIESGERFRPTDGFETSGNVSPVRTHR